MSRRDIMRALNLSDEKHFREHYQQATIRLGLMEMTIPTKPRRPRIEVSEHWFTVIFPRTESQAESEVSPNTGTYILKTTAVPSLSQEAQEAQEAQAEAQEAQVVLLAWEVAVLELCVDHDATGAELLERAGYSIRTGNFKRGLDKLLNKGLLAMIIPGKPRSSKQKYRLTALGKKLLEAQDMVKG